MKRLFYRWTITFHLEALPRTPEVLQNLLMSLVVSEEGNVVGEWMSPPKNSNKNLENMNY